MLAVEHSPEFIGGSRGGTGFRTPPEKSQKYRGFFLQYWSGSPEKSQNYQASIQCWVIIGMPAKRHLNCGPMMAR